MTIDFVSEDDKSLSSKQVFSLVFLSLPLEQQAETIDIGTCDQAVPKAYPDKGISHLIDYLIINFIYIALLVSCYFYNCTC